MNQILEQILLYILQNYVNPMFEPIVQCRRVIRSFRKFDYILSNTKYPLRRLKQSKHDLNCFCFPVEMYCTSVLKQNIINILDTLIEIQKHKNKKILKLKNINDQLIYKNNKLHKDIKELLLKPPINNIIFNADSSKKLKQAMTIHCTVE